jgi:hypothetical protein
MKFFETLFEIVGWIGIAISPTGIGALIGVFCYFKMDAPWGLVTAIALTTLGFAIGAIFATRAWKRGGTMNLLSRVDRVPELDGDPDQTN